MDKKTGVTSSDVARLAGVSQASVSRAFNPKSSMSAPTRTHILQVAKELNYSPPISQRAPSKEQCRVGLVISDITNPFYPEVLEILSRKLREAYLEVVLFCIPRGSNLDDYITPILSSQLDVLILATVTPSASFSQAARQIKSPIIMFNRVSELDDALSVACDNAAGGSIIAQHLLATGCQRCCYVAGRTHASTNTERERGFRSGLSNAAMDLYDRIDGQEFSYDKARELVVNRFRKSGVKPDALFCANDIMALGALDGLRHELNIRIPEEVAVVGFDDIPMARWASFNLTTVRQRINLMIDQTLELVNQLLAGQNVMGTTHLIKGSLIVRGTTPS